MIFDSIDLCRLSEIAKARGQKLSQMALSWLLRNRRVTSVLIGASSPEQVLENIGAIENTEFSAEENASIDSVCTE